MTLSSFEYFKYIHAIKHSTNDKYEKKHFYYEIIVFFYGFRMLLSLILTSRYLKLWKIYRNYDIINSFTVEVLFSCNNYLIISIVLLCIFSVALDRYGNFKIDGFSNSWFEQWACLIHYLSKLSSFQKLKIILSKRYFKRRFCKYQFGFSHYQTSDQNYTLVRQSILSNVVTTFMNSLIGENQFFWLTIQSLSINNNFTFYSFNLNRISHTSLFIIFRICYKFQVVCSI